MLFRSIALCDGNADRSNLYSSNDGESWSFESYPLTQRNNHRITVHNNKVWMTAGYSQGGLGGLFRNDVWQSDDGITWIETTSAGDFSARTSHAFTSFQGKLWVIGGKSSSGGLNDVWSSVNGIDWSLEVANAPFGQREEHDVEVFENRLWLIGGSADSGIWSTSDGVIWKRSLSKSFLFTN